MQDLIYIVTLLVQEGCEGDDFTVTITVNPAAQVGEPLDYEYCDGDTAEITLLLQMKLMMIL